MNGLEKFLHLIEALENLPSVGKKSATRLAYHICMGDQFSGMKLAHAIESALATIRKCRQCGSMSEDELCSICVDDERDSELLCIVENAKDILLMEENGIFNGRYFVLSALEEEALDLLSQRVSEGVKEVIFALTPSIATDALILYVEDRLKSFDLNFTKIAQGVPTGVSLENVDMVSLTRALEDRVKA
jgi:recombination protein RecR